MLDIFLLGTFRWSERFIYFGSFALWALKFHYFFVGRLIANKKKINRNVIERARRISTQLKNKTRPN